jgi:hypothetical protein
MLLLLNLLEPPPPLLLLHMENLGSGQRRQVGGRFDDWWDSSVTYAKVALQGAAYTHTHTNTITPTPAPLLTHALT